MISTYLWPRNETDERFFFGLIAVVLCSLIEQLRWPDRSLNFALLAAALGGIVWVAMIAGFVTC